ncbi:MAG: XdhC family protein [Methylobacter sp.]|nr:XdhC family protein [Methylobacter sp.]MDP2097571.1 XdhC family protein [Methylobacter sp.]MDP2429867.1 XdhC family protein [Methylobacter sp.]MDP3053307.1 XdhC family protein [Methylobacter sp.]MDP3361053.1 XdhC family protein [Methylobacter sp.]
MICDILDLQLELRQVRRPYALATVVEILGSSSAKPAAKALIDLNGKVMAGWVGGGCAQSLVSGAALACFETGEPRMIDVDLNDEVFGAGMPCGGSMRVYVEPVLPKPLLWLMGHGRIVESLCEFAYRLGFEVIVNDPQATVERFPYAGRIISDDCRYQQLQPQVGDFVVVASHHKGDYDSLTRAVQSEALYIALVSSRKRADLVLARLAQEGFDKTSLARVRAPAGLNLGAKLPEEIALSIVSEMVLLRRGGNGEPLNRI